MVEQKRTSRHSTSFPATYAAAVGAAVMLLGMLWPATGITAWMHSLLAASKQHPLPGDGPCDVAVILGYALHRNGTCTRPLQSRVEVGVNLYQQGGVAHLLFSGAHPGGGLRNVSEANAMLQYALQVAPQLTTRPVGSWLLEEASTSTRTNALFSLDLIARQQQQRQQQQQQQVQGSHPDLHQAEGSLGNNAQVPPGVQGVPLGWRRVVVVTNPFHQLRSYWVFRKAAAQAGLDVQLYVAPAPFAPHCGWGHPALDAAMDQLDFWRELAALAEYAHVHASHRFLLASQDATTCVILLVWCPVTHSAWIAHLDGPLSQQAAAALLEAVDRMQQPQLYLVGGYEDDRGLGPELALHCLTLLHQGCSAAVTLHLAVLGSANTAQDGAPCATSLVFDTHTAALSCGLPPDRGPAVARRFAAQYCRQHPGDLLSIWDSSTRQLVLPPFTLTLADWHRHQLAAQLELGDGDLLAVMSTSPRHEPPWFPADMRAQVRFLLEASQPGSPAATAAAISSRYAWDTASGAWQHVPAEGRSHIHRDHHPQQQQQVQEAVAAEEQSAMLAVG